MASLPGGVMEILMTNNQGGLRRRVQTGSGKKLKQVHFSHICQFSIFNMFSFYTNYLQSGDFVVLHINCILAITPTDNKKNAEMPKSAQQTTSSQEPSYFEIPTKETPSQEQEASASAAAEPVHGHASFTIEFDPGASGKVTVKDRVAKVGPETRPRPKRAAGEELSPLQTAMVAAEVKVADWLAQNELPLAIKETVAEDDGESVKSDVPVHLRSLKGVCI